MKKEWFVLHALTGQENKVQQSITARVKLKEMGEYVGQCLVPTEKVQETKNGKKRTVTKKVFPGYVLVELALYDDTKPVDAHGRKQIIEDTWQFLRETPGVIGFIGGERPMPLRQDEVDAIVNPSAVSREVVRPKINFNVNDTVKINDGPFLGLTGQVSMVDPDKGKLKVEVSIFNRKVLVDAEYWQVEKVPEKESSSAELPAE
jgi:transcriptional antiterminator NusG